MSSCELVRFSSPQIFGAKMRDSVDSCSLPFSQRSLFAAFSVFSTSSRSGNSRTAVKVLLVLFILLFVCQFCFVNRAFFSPSNGSIPVAAKTAYPFAANCKVGNYVVFGNYTLGSSGGPEPIEWLVLENSGNTALLVSKFCLDCQPFNSKFADTNWRDCDLRKWLNSDFLNKAFNSDEQQQIVESTIYTYDNPDFGTKGCGETTDKVFCLSLNEAIKFFKSDNDRNCRATEYAIARNVFSDSDYCWFWLRSPGCNASCAALVFNDGAADSDGFKVSADDIGVRPALRIKLK